MSHPTEQEEIDKPGKGLGGETGFIQPHYILAAFAALALAAWAFGMPEETAAKLALAGFAAASLAHPANSATILLLCVPFFLSPAHRPYIWMLEAMAWWTALILPAQLYFRRGKPAGPLVALCLPLGVTAALAIPLDAKEFPYIIWASEKNEFFYWWLYAHPATCAHYYRVVADTLSGLAVFYTAAAFYPTDIRRPVQSLLYSIAVLAGFISIIGILVSKGIIMKGLGEWTYLGLAHSDWVSKPGMGITAFAMNRHYFAQHILLSAPMAASFLALSRNKLWAAGMSLALVGLLAAALAMTGQRSPLVFFMAGCAFWAYLYHRMSGAPGKGKAAFAWAALASAGLLAAIFLFGRGIPLGLERFSWEHISNDPRYYLWQVALRMFMDSPLLGVGTGRYSYRFLEFYDGTETLTQGVKASVFKGEAHSTYFQILAEQGLLGVIGWAGLFLAVFYYAWKLAGSDTEGWKKGAAVTILVSLFLWAALAHVNNIFYVRVLGLYFWALAGILVKLSLPQDASYPLAPSATGGKVFYALLAVAFAFQAYQAQARPITERFSAGFYSWEKGPGGKKARWTRKRAVVNAVDYAGGRLNVHISSPLPGDNPPQKVVLIFGDQVRNVELAGSKWTRVSFPRGYRGGDDGILLVEAAYTVNPAAIGAGKDTRDLGVYMMEIPRKRKGE